MRDKEEEEEEYDFEYSDDQGGEEPDVEVCTRLRLCFFLRGGCVWLGVGVGRLID
jgi:hypothetical protein